MRFKLSVLSVFSLILLAIFITPTEAFAVIQSLDGLTPQNQTFTDDSNVTITPSGSTHTLGWQGFLPVSRGGTGVGSFTAGSLLFSNGSTFAENNSKLFWDNTNNRLGIGTSSPIYPLDVKGETLISGNLRLYDSTNPSAGEHDIILGGGQTNTGHIYGLNAPNGSLRDGSTIAIIAGVGDNYLRGGHIDIMGGFGGNGGGSGGAVNLFGGNATGSNGGGGNVEFKTGLKFGSGDYGVYKFYDPTQTYAGILDFSLLTSNKTFTYPNTSGTFGLLEANQTWTGLNKFEASTNSTIYVGSSVKSGCIALGDSDGSGITYVTANDGLLTASAIQPSICQ